MQSLGFIDCTNAEIPHYRLDISAYMQPSENIRKAFNNSGSDPLEDLSIISPEVAKLFYLECHKKS